MASRKGRTPTFDLPPVTPAEPQKTGWTYRTDKPVETRGVTERAIAAIAKPFEVALVCLLVPFRRKPPHALVLFFLASAIAVMAGSCRHVENYSGVEVIDNGARLKISSKEPECGCLTISNETEGPLTLEASYKGEHRGTLVLPAHGRETERFDWAGEENDDVYYVTARTAAGKPAAFGKDVMFARPGWLDCSSSECNWGPLKLDAAIAAGH